MEPLWSLVVATGGNRWKFGSARKQLEQAKSVAVDCGQLPERAHGKEGVSGSSPEEGFSPGWTKVRVRPVFFAATMRASVEGSTEH